MPSAGAVCPPTIIILRDPREALSSTRIDSETYLELTCDTAYTKIYFTTDGTKPNPFQIGVAGRESTFKYRAPFQLKEGKRTIKAIAVSRDGLQESAVVSKTFQVDSPPEYSDDGYSFIESCDFMSTMTTTTASTVKMNKKNRRYKDERRPHSSYQATSTSSSCSTTETGSTADDYLYMDMYEENKRSKKKEKRSRSRSQSPQYVPNDPRQAWGDVRASYQGYPQNGNTFVPWAGDVTPPAQPPVLPVTAGTVFYPTVSTINTRPYSPEPDMGYLTRQMVQRLDEQRKMTVADVRQAVKEIATPRQEIAPPPQEYLPPRHPEPKACSPGNGNWREQLEHVYAHLIEHAQIDPDFRIGLGEPKLGRIVEADFKEEGDDTLVLTVSIARYGQIRRPKPKAKPAPKPIPKPVPKPAPKKAPTPMATPPPSKPPSRRPSKQIKPPTPPPEPEPEPVPERDPDPYFVTEEYPQEGTLKPYPNFDTEADAEQLRKAMKGLGTNEDAITNVLGARSATQRVEIARTFKTMFGKDLVNELKSELSGNYLTVCKGLCLSPAQFDAKALNKAIKGLGTDEQALVEILCTRTNAQIKAFTAEYKAMFNKDLEKDIIGDTSGHFQRMLVALLMANRDESKEFDQTKAEQDATKLYDAGEQKKFGTDESRFNVILVSRSYAHLRAVFEAYERIAGKDIEDSLKSEMSGDLLNGMLSIVRCIKQKPKMFAKVLHKSMKGLGTDDESLLRVVVSRCEVDMVQIKEAFQADYKQTLGQFIADDTSGDFRKILLKLIGDPHAGKKK